MEGWIDLANRKKIPASIKVASNQKRPTRITNPESFYDQTPVWSFSLCDFYHEKWGFSSSSQSYEDLSTLLLRLKDFEGQSWRQILSDTSGRKNNTKNHAIPINNLDKEAQKRLEEIKLDDIDKLYSLSVTGKRRVWGTIIDGTFCIVWYDTEHEVCPSKKRHT